MVVTVNWTEYGMRDPRNRLLYLSDRSSVEKRSDVNHHPRIRPSHNVESQT